MSRSLTDLPDRTRAAVEKSSAVGTPASAGQAKVEHPDKFKAAGLPGGR